MQNIDSITNHYASMRNIDTSLLRTFVAVAEARGMTAAADVLNLTQAAVSQQVKRLEDVLGCILFERRRGGLVVTDAGERLFGRARRILTLNDELLADLRQPEVTGDVRLGIPYDLVAVHLPAVLKNYSRIHPHASVSLDCRPSAELRAACRKGELDIAVVEELTPGSDAEILADERLVWVGARGGEAHSRRPLPLSVGSENCAFRGPLLRALDEAGIIWRTVSEIGNLDAMSATVHADLAVTALLASTIPQGSEVLGHAEGLPALPVFTISLYLPPRQTTPAAAALVKILRDGFRQRALARESELNS